ncbi:MAG TPA: glycosyltransferase family protein [Promineifilum sp.]|nr:glycosyltransferase family protein [Promineifilum sp.]
MARLSSPGGAPPHRVVTVVQARTGSTRLPNKVLRPLAGSPLLVRMVERVRAARLAGTVVVATTTAPDDDPIADLCRAEGWPCFRGDPLDLLDRHYQAGLAYGATAVAKIPSDCPLIDPAIIDRVLGHFLDHPGAFDFVSNLHPASYPDGNDVEIMTLDALATAWREATRPLEREHTTPYLWENPDRFRLGNVLWETGLDYSKSHRWTIDYEEDYQFIRAVYEALYPANPRFGLGDILAYGESHPHVAALNSAYAGEYWYRHHPGELKTVSG